MAIQELAKASATAGAGCVVEAEGKARHGLT